MLEPGDTMSFLDEPARRLLGRQLPDWILSPDGRSLSRRFEFKNFEQAFTFMSRMAEVTQRMNHHPDWSNLDRWVQVCLSTHDLDSVSQRDVEWAMQAEQTVRSLQGEEV
jgi:4a-hydroxytetrahydrobiopterin dehydratase